MLFNTSAKSSPCEAVTSLHQKSILKKNQASLQLFYISQVNSANNSKTHFQSRESRSLWGGNPSRKTCAITASPHAPPRTVHRTGSRERERTVNMRTAYDSRRTNPSFLMSPSSHHVHSPFVPKKDILVPWGMTILMSRDELLIEWRGQVRQFTCSMSHQTM